MEFEDLPYDVLVDLLLNVKRLYKLRVNKKLNSIIQNITETFNEKFNALVPDWRNNTEQLLKILAYKDAFLSLKFLGNNFVDPVDIYKNALMYGTLDLINKISEYFSIDFSEDKIMFYTASGDNVEAFKHFNDLGYKYNVDEILNAATVSDSIKVIEYLDQVNENGLNQEQLESIANNAAKYDYLDLFKFVQSKFNPEEQTFECNGVNDEKIKINEILFRSILIAVDNESNKIIDYALSKNLCICDIAKEAATVGNLGLIQMLFKEYNCESIAQEIAVIAAENGNTDIVDFLSENYDINVEGISNVNDYDVIEEYIKANNL